MQSLMVETHNETPNLASAPRPAPHANQVLVRISACGLNFADLLMIRGTYQETPPLPFALGMEYCGTVAQLGPDVQHLKIGDRVAVFAGHGGLAEYACAAEADCIPLPQGLDMTTAAGVMVAHGTAHLALTRRGNLQAGHSVLIFGAAGGTGLAAVQIAKAMGAKVIACARGEDKLAALRDMGADHVFDSTDPNLKANLKALPPVDIVYDTVGGDLCNIGLRCCAPEARYLVIGFASGNVPQIPANILLVKNIAVHGFYWGAVRGFAPKGFADSLMQVFEMVANGNITPQIQVLAGLESAANGLKALKARRSIGKLVVQICAENT